MENDETKKSGEVQAVQSVEDHARGLSFLWGITDSGVSIIVCSFLGYNY